MKLRSLTGEGRNFSALITSTIVQDALGIDDLDATILTIIWKRFEGAKVASSDAILDFLGRQQPGAEEEQIRVSLQRLELKDLVITLGDGESYRPDVDGTIRELEREYNDIQAAADALRTYSAEESLQLQHRFSEQRLEGILPDFTAILRGLHQIGSSPDVDLERVTARLVKHGASSLTSTSADHPWLLDYQAAFREVLGDGLQVEIYLPSHWEQEGLLRDENVKELGLTLANFRFYDERAWPHLEYLRAGFIEGDLVVKELPVIFLALMDPNPHSDISAGYIIRNHSMIESLRPMFENLDDSSWRPNDG